MCVPAYVTIRNVDVCGGADADAVGVATADGDGTDCHEPDMLLLLLSALLLSSAEAAEEAAIGLAYPDVAAASEASVDVIAVPNGALSSPLVVLVLVRPSVAIFMVADIIGGLAKVGARVAPATGGEGDAN